MGEEFPEEPVGSLEAIHLASLRVLDRELGGVEVASCDQRVRRNAVALGFVVVFVEIAPHLVDPPRH